MNVEEVRQVKGRGLNEYASSPSSPLAPSSFSTASASTSDSTSHKPTLLPGSIVTEVDPQTGFTQNFTCGRCLGEGGFGRCIEVSDGTNSYALKAVSRSILQKPKNFEKLCTEIAIHRRMKHKHIVNFIRSFHDKYYVYMLLEKCQYGTVRDLMKVRPMKVDEAQYVLLQCLSAVQYMHRNNVIHRDLKPGNIMLDGNLSVKIGDFGLATEMKFDGERKRTMCGTPNYMAPEIIEQHRDGHSFEVDTWSLGVILYTVLVGEPPFQMSNVPLTYKRIRQGNIEFPPHLSIYAKSLISSMLSTSPEKRPTLIEVRSHPFFVNPPHPMNTPVSLYAVALSEQRRKLAKANAAAHRASAPAAIAAVPQSSKPTDPSSAPLAVASENFSSTVPVKAHLERGKTDTDSEEVVLFAVRNTNPIRGNERGAVPRSNSALFHVYRDAARPSSARKRVVGGAGSPTAAASDSSPPPLVGGGSSAQGHMPPPPPTPPPSSRHADADGNGRGGRESHPLPSKAQPLSRPSSVAPSPPPSSTTTTTTTGNVPLRSARTSSARPPGNPTPRSQSSKGGVLPPSHGFPPAVPVGNRLLHTMGRRGRYPQMDNANEEGGGGGGGYGEEEFRPGTGGGIPPPYSSSSPPPVVGGEGGGPTGRRRPSGTATAALRLLGPADPSPAVHSPRASSPILVRRGGPTPMMAAALPPSTVSRSSGSCDSDGSGRSGDSAERDSSSRRSRDGSGGGGGTPALLQGGRRSSAVRGPAGNAEGRRVGLLSSMRSPLRQRPSTHPSAPPFSTAEIERGGGGGAGKRKEGGGVSPSSSSTSSSSSSSLSFHPLSSKKVPPSAEAGKRVSSAALPVSKKEPMAAPRRTRAGEKEEKARLSRAVLLPPLLQPLVWVRCAIDFTCKYGFSFLLSSGVVGALFNDDTKLFWDLSSDQVLYTVRVIQPANTTTGGGGGGAAVKKGSSGEDALQNGGGPPKRYACDSPSWFPMCSYPETLQKKITLIKYFERAFVTVGGHYSDKVKRCSKFYSGHDGAGGSLVPPYDGREGGGVGGAVPRLPAPLEGDVRATPSDGAPALPPPGDKSYVYLKGWVVLDGASVFRFSNQMVQICFSDGSEMFFFWLLELVTHRYPGNGPNHPPIQRTIRITEAVKDEKLLAGLTIVRKAYSNLSTF